MNQPKTRAVWVDKKSHFTVKLLSAISGIPMSKLIEDAVMEYSKRLVSQGLVTPEQLLKMESNNDVR